MLKKIFLSSLIILSILIITNKKEKNALVFKETLNDNYEQIYLLFEDNNLTTNNFDSYFQNLTILKIYPYINPIYQDRLKPNYSYSFTNGNHNSNLIRFKNNYVNKLKNIGLYKEANNYALNGVIIRKVLIYEQASKVKKLFTHFNNIKYSFNLNGTYYSL